jgi:hypothetical protein
MATHPQNYTLGRGKVYLDRLDADGNSTGFRYIGNTPGFSLNFSTETVEHRSSDEGINEIDDSATVSVDRNLTLATDNIDKGNLALAFLGEALDISQSAATIVDEEINAVEQGRYYQLGATALNPAGVRALTEHSEGVNIVLTDDDGTPVEFDETDDYEIDMVSGLLYIVPGGAITDGTNLLAGYKTSAASRERVISGNEPIDCAIKYVSANPKGAQKDVLLPLVTLSPDGDFTLKSGNDWQTLNFRGVIRKKAGYEAAYIDGRAVAS